MPIILGILTATPAARFDTLIAVVAGTTLGIPLVDVPAVFLGDSVARRVPLRVVRSIAAIVFAGLGVLTLLNVCALF